MDLFYRSGNLQYFRRLIQIPQLPENPPNFLRASALSEHISPVVVIPLEASSPDGEPITDLVEMESPSRFESKFDDLFGSSFSSDPFNFNSQNGTAKDEKDRLIEQMHKEIGSLKDELRNFKAESHRLVMQLKGRVSELEAELAEQQHLRRQALDEGDFLRAEVEELKRRHEDSEKAQRSLTEVERKAQATEQRYTKLKEKYSELVQNHADLLRKNAEVTRQVTAARQVQSDVERDRRELEDALQRLREQAQRKTQEQVEVLEALRREQSANRQELEALRSTAESEAQVRRLALGGRGYASGTVEALRQQLLDKPFALLQSAITEAEQIVQDALSRLDDPVHIGCTSSAGQPGHGLLHWVGLGLGAHAGGGVILELNLPVSSVPALLEACRQCGSETLSYLGALKDKASSEGADCLSVRNCLNRITAIGEDLRPRGLDIKQEELGDLVDKEMAATATAIEAAAARIEEMLNKARAGDTGVNLEVNERILGSCTDLMQAIQVLVLASKDLQREIVESGRGAGSPKEFYAKNSRWTEGLISAAKAVGWGATVMVDAADLVVQGKGKFEELLACSHEIAGSTAQLVAASKVKADKDSTNLSKLQAASRGVNQATASLVASTKSGKSQIQEKCNMDFSTITLTQIKRQEMDSQVRVLELESQLQKERQRLGEIRKKHYELAGVAEGWDENGR
uniref:Huntingtin interacting protein 1 n=1 Tax=Salvator merianae TaxID=96440 RepID=A0A8D0BP74_SALMN